ncbi:MAG: ribosome biogenesis GTP-binding protein YihA/YsxC [Eubacteriales bacterium]|nr:ribosome biogenesis GTP-binding protein YihA/YsxC [Eubacteriales bacterium]
MIIRKAELEAVAVRKNQYPPQDRKEIAFAGRSNVGKSSLINLLLNRKKLARVSGNPGKTRTLNFYNINDEFRIVDLPGYGYAKVSRSISEDWGPMMEDYLTGRENLVRVIQLVDIRHKPSLQDCQMYEWLRHFGLSGTVIATKADKVSRNELNRSIAVIRNELQLGDQDVVLPVSTLKRTGVEEILETLDALLLIE